MPHKVTFDTNILFAGSIIETSGELGFQIKHDFHDFTIKLIQYIRKNPSKRIGITTNFIETEAYKALSDAVETEIKKHVSDILKEYNVFSAVLNICSDNMKQIFTYLIREPVDENEVRRIYYDVDSFYSELRYEAKRITEKLKIRTDMRVGATPKQYRRFMRKIYSQQERWFYAQLLNLIMYKDIEYNDKRILSEVIYLHRIYKSLLGNNLKSYIASTDYHFSPIKDDGRTSSYITNAIKSRYEIICSWPDEIYNLIKK